MSAGKLMVVLAGMYQEIHSHRAIRIHKMITSLVIVRECIVLEREGFKWYTLKWHTMNWHTIKSKTYSRRGRPDFATETSNVSLIELDSQLSLRELLLKLELSPCCERSSSRELKPCVTLRSYRNPT